MGTSNSYGSPKDTSHLIPSWARQSSGDIDSNSTDTGIPPDDGQVDQNIPANANSNDQNVQVQNHESRPQEKWKNAKNVMSRYAGSGQGSLTGVGRAYIRAKGGAQKAAQSVISGKSTARNLASFFATTARTDISQGLNSIGLGQLIGENIDTVFSGIIDALSGNGENFDENIARQAIEDALTSSYEQCSENQNFESLEHLTPEQLKSAIENFVSGYIYKRWLQELGNCIERKAVSEPEAIKLEVEVKIYVRDLVNLELNSRSIFSIDWNGDEGQQIIDSLYEDVYSLIEEG